ncbi:MAG: LptF/LptG family permease [Pseudomonadota bacterium]
MNRIDSVFMVYVGRMFATRFIGLLIFFIILLQMLDLLNNSTEIYAAEGADWRSIAKYIGLRAPQIASQFAPFAALLGIVLTLTALNQRSEVTIMRAAGMSAQRVLFPIGFICFLIASTHFLFHETLVVKTFGELAYWEANDYAMDLPPEGATRTDIRYAHEFDFISAASAARKGDEIQLNDVVIYERDETGLTTHVVEAKSAVFSQAGWLLNNVTSVKADDLSSRTADTAEWSTSLDPEVLFAISLNPERATLPVLMRRIGQLRAAGADVANELTSFLGRFSKPLSTLVMPLLGAVAGYGVTRSGAQLARAAGGAALGFGYFIAENLMLALGKLGAAPAVLGAFLPFALFMIVGFAILLAMEN